MSDAIRQIGEKLAESAVSQPQQTEVQEPSEESVAQFEKAMSQEGTRGEGTDSVSQTETPKEVSPGDRILQGLERMKEARQEHVENVNRILDGKGSEPLSVRDALMLQYELVQLNFQQELTSKGADKTSQAVQSVLRNQG